MGSVHDNSNCLICSEIWDCISTTIIGRKSHEQPEIKFKQSIRGKTSRHDVINGICCSVCSAELIHYSLHFSSLLGVFSCLKKLRKFHFLLGFKDDRRFGKIRSEIFQNLFRSIDGRFFQRVVIVYK